MPATMTNAEYVDFLNAEAVARAEARTLANIARRAMTLFTDGGYTATCYDATGYDATGHVHSYAVRSPEGSIYTVYISDTPDCEVFGDSCSCPCFAKRRTCKHLQAVRLEVHESAQIAEWEAAEELRNDGQFDRYAEF